MKVVAHKLSLEENAAAIMINFTTVYDVKFQAVWTHLRLQLNFDDTKTQSFT